MQPATQQAVQAFRQALLALPDSVLSTAVAAICEVRGPAGWLDLSREEPPARLRTVITQAPLRSFVDIGRRSYVDVLGGTLSSAPALIACLNSMSASLNQMHGRPDDLSALITARLQAYRAQQEHQRAEEARQARLQ